MAEDHDGAGAEQPALLEAGADERGPDAVTLPLRQNRHRRQTHDLQRGMAGERHGRKHDVPDEGALVLCD